MDRIDSGDQATPDIYIYGLWPVPPEFTQIDCVQQATFSTRVCLSTFARWKHGYVLLLLVLARRRHCSAEWAIRQALPRIRISSSLFYVDCRATLTCRLSRTTWLDTRQSVLPRAPRPLTRPLNVHVGLTTISWNICGLLLCIGRSFGASNCDCMRQHTHGALNVVYNSICFIDHRLIAFFILSSPDWSKSRWELRFARWTILVRARKNSTTPTRPSQWARECLHCCKSHQRTIWIVADLGVSELQNQLTYHSANMIMSIS